MSAGKGDKFRKVDKKKFDENYDRIFKKPCPICLGLGKFQEGGTFSPYVKCDCKKVIKLAGL